MHDPVFDHYTIKVENLERSATFYKNVLGLQEITNRTEKSHIRWFSLGSGELHIVKGKTNHINTNVGVHLALRVTNFEGFLNHLKDHNITIHDSKGNPGSYTTRNDGVLQVYFKDPDGYWIEINDAEN